MKSLYIKDNKGMIREWRIGKNDDNDIIIEHGVLGGSMQRQVEHIEEGKAGRSIDDQIMLRIASRISRQLDKGYSPNIEDAEKKPVNSLGLVKPMLAQKIESVKNIDFDEAYVQRKYDGNRMMIANVNGENIAYTRNGKIIDSVDHILREIEIPEGTILDGEIYCHGYPLQTIVSWVKRKQENSLMLKYHAYDIVSPLKYSDRMIMLRDIEYGENAEFVETIKVRSMEEVDSYFREFRHDDYEGAIIRWGAFGYEDGKRSKSLVKVKGWQDDEFMVIDIEHSADGWAVLTCMMNNGKTFSVSAPGTIEQKKEVLENREKYLGKYVTVKYSTITNAGKVFHPVAENWRE